MTTPTRKPIVAGVDQSAEGTWAAAVACRIASADDTQCLLAHAVRETRIPPGQVPGVPDSVEFRHEVLRLTRAQLLDALQDTVPEPCLESLDVRFGPPARVLTTVAAERDAGLIVVGGKRHPALARWLAGGTAHQTVRLAEVPTLIATTSAVPRFQRILAAVDLSGGAARTIAAAERFAQAFDAALRVMHVIEPLPFAAELRGFVDQPAYIEAATLVVETTLWPRVRFPGAECVLRHGWAQRAIEFEAARWGADLLVVGSHGRSWFDRTVLGSVTQGLLNDLPASLLVVPIRTVAPLDASDSETRNTEAAVR